VVEVEVTIGLGRRAFVSPVLPGGAVHDWIF
jgi:hypothetical protein